MKRNLIIHKKHISFKTWIYMIVITVGLANIFFPYVIHADIFGFEIQDVYAEITSQVKETNELLSRAFEFTQISPYDIINNISKTDQGKIAIAIQSASKTVALVVATLLLMIDFFRKTINFEWSSKWENILLFLIKIIVIKQVVQNADVIIGYIYSGFNYINKVATTTKIDFLPCVDMHTYEIQEKQSFIEQAKKGWWDFWYDKGAGDVYNTYTYNIAHDAVKLFYPNATFPSSTTLNENGFSNPTTAAIFMPTLEIILWQPYFLVLKAIAYVIFVITIGRIFELCIYTLLAPLPLITFASETSHEVAKSFIKNYISVILQVTVIVVMFITYYSVTKYISDNKLYEGTKLLQFVVLIALGLGVTKSGTWAKKICGAT